MNNPILECANCDWTGAYSETDEIDNLWERCEPGEPIPHGQCPECGALCYEPDNAAPTPPAQLPENKAAIWILNSAIPDGNTVRPISCLEVFTNEAEARAAYDKTMREEWEHNAPCDDDGEPMPYPGDPDAAQEAIVADKAKSDHDEPWGQWTLTRHEIAPPPAQLPSPDAMAALRAVKDWHTRAPIAEIEVVEASIGENFPQALVDAALAAGNLPKNEGRSGGKHYLVSWEIDVEESADNPEEAAAQALIVMRDNDPDNTATMFRVRDMATGEIFDIDLSRE